MIWHTEKPIPDKRCLISRDGNIEIAIFRQAGPDDDVGGWLKKGLWISDKTGLSYYLIDAWSPLPEPYKGGE